MAHTAALLKQRQRGAEHARQEDETESEEEEDVCANTCRPGCATDESVLEHDAAFAAALALVDLREKCSARSVLEDLTDALTSLGAAFEVVASTDLLRNGHTLGEAATVSWGEV